jgi:hypothetical protein
LGASPVTTIGFDGTEFEWNVNVADESTGGGVRNVLASKLSHKETGCFFRFGDARLDFSPGDKRKNEWYNYELRQADGGWENMLRVCFTPWLKRVKAESEAPDLWATINNGQGLHPKGTLIH